MKKRLLVLLLALYAITVTDNSIYAGSLRCQCPGGHQLAQDNRNLPVDQTLAQVSCDLYCQQLEGTPSSYAAIR